MVATAKEGLCWSPAEWPGVHVVGELCRGYSVAPGGIWHDQSAEYEARRRGDKIKRRDFQHRYSIELTPLLCWQHRDAADVARDIRGLVESIGAETRAEHELHGTSPLGVRAILRQSPHRRPKKTKKSPAPWVHSASKEARLAMIEAYRQFVASFRAAAAPVGA